MAAISSIIALGGLVGGNLSIIRLFTSPHCVLTDVRRRERRSSDVKSCEGERNGGYLWSE